MKFHLLLLIVGHTVNCQFDGPVNATTSGIPGPTPGPTDIFLPYNESNGDGITRHFQSSWNFFTSLSTNLLLLPSGRILLNTGSYILSGIVLHSVHQRGFISLITNESVTFDKIVNITTGFNQNFSDYQPSMAIILTYEDIPIQVLQMVLSTDGTATFVIIMHNYSTFTSEVSIELNDEDRRSLRIPINAFEEISFFRIDGNCITSGEMHCPLNSLALECTPRLICACEEGIQPPLCSDFFPFGESYGDKVGPRASDNSVGVDLNVPVVFFQKKELNIFISTNGIISFQSKFNSFNPVPFPHSSVPLIAPFWADFDFRETGRLYYRVTEDQKTMTKFSNIISKKNSNLIYRPKLCVIVTWNSATFSSSDTILTFQVVLATDGEVSFAAFLYSKPNEVLNITSSSYGIVGFDAGDHLRSTTIIDSRQREYTLEVSNIFRIDGNCITSGEIHCPLHSLTLECTPQLICVCEELSSCSDFFPFGESNGDRVGPRAVDKSVGVNLNVPLVFFQKKELNIIFISTNGIISFQSEFNSFNPISFPSSPVPLIAPFWADFDFREIGRIYYRVAEDQKTMTRFSNILLKKNPNLIYRPKLCVIVTWNSATFSPSDRRILTFQVVLATDGEVSFAAFLYSKPNEVLNIASSINGIAGFDAGDQHRSTTIIDSRQREYTLEVSNIFRIDGNCISGVSPGAVCGLNSTSLECHDNLTISSCLCEPGTTEGNNCKLTEFFPFGIGSGDTVGPRAIDATSNFIHLDIPIIFYQKEEKDFYVSTNGLISFQEMFDSHIVNRLPRMDLPPLIAPFWADYSFRDAGTLYYRVVNDSVTLSYAAQKITNANGAFESYTPTSAVIVTWFQSKVFRLESNLAMNFQAILLTDGNVSFAVLLYGDLIDSDVREFRWLIGGFSAGDGRRGSYSLSSLDSSSYSKKDQVYRIDGHCVVHADRDMCRLNSVPILCGNEFNSLSCLCNTGTISSENSTCLEYFQFGPRAGDATIPPLEEPTATNQSLTLSTPLVFYGNPQSTINIFLCGEIVLPGNFSSVPKIAYNMSSNTCLMSWSYLHYRVSVDNTTLDKVATMITDFNQDFTNFYPTLAVIITWILDDNNQTSVQTILCTDGKISFGIFLFEHPVLNRLSSIDFHPGDNMTRKSMIRNYELQAKNIFRIDGDYCITTASFRDVCKLNSFASRCDNSSATSCSCYSGYENEDEKNCKDIDECVTDSPCSGNAECKNTEGSFMCECNSGFVGDGFNCTDIDECEVGGTHGCTEICNNTDGGFFCSCKDGYRITSDNRTCEDIDECGVGTNNCTEICNNTDGGFFCSCKDGYQITSDNRTCEDINECGVGTHGCTEICNNTDGGFFCTCKDGYQIASDNRTCEDIDECVTDSPCSSNAECKNTENSFMCECDSGFVGDGFNCTDIDECVTNSPCSSNAECKNTEGSFTCECNSGFVGDGFNCTDIVGASNNSAVNSAVIGGILSVGVILAVLIIVIGLILTVYYKKRKINKETNVIEERGEDNKNIIKLQQMSVQSTFKQNIPKQLIIHSCNLDLGKTIGQGEFGIVYKSRLKKSHCDTISDTVAVKTLKGFVQNELVRDLLKECVKMQELDHPNVLRLIGVCLDGGPAPYLVMPFMDNGSLLSHLKAERESIVLDPNCSNFDDINPIKKKLMGMCLQVANGMEYLASKRIIHRDLAARNCMIDVNFVIKVADFGLAESIDPTKEYFRQDQNAIIMLPIKWLALESINEGVFSEKSDVWAYGVTCWEIFSGGKTPYPGIIPMDLPYQLKTGLRMDKPLNAACSDDIYSLMLDCWEKNAQQRPTFTKLVDLLSSQLAVVAEYTDFSSPPDVVNVQVEDQF